MYNMFFGRRKTFQVNNAETTYKVHYLGNVMTSLIKGVHNHRLSHILNEEVYLTGGELDKDGELSVVVEEYEEKVAPAKSVSATNIDKPVKILWDNHLKHNGHAGLKMKLTLTQGGLRVVTKDHGVTEYYGHRIHFVQAHPIHPKLFIWVYQHVGKNLKTEIRCHAALCERSRESREIAELLNERIQRTFLEYKREKQRQQNSRLCNKKNGGLLTGQVGQRKRTFRSTKNYKPPIQHGMSSAPKLDDVLEEEEGEERLIDGFDEVEVDQIQEEEEEEYEQFEDDSLEDVNEEDESEIMEDSKGGLNYQLSSESSSSISSSNKQQIGINIEINSDVKRVANIKESGKHMLNESTSSSCSSSSSPISPSSLLSSTSSNSSISQPQPPTLTQHDHVSTSNTQTQTQTSVEIYESNKNNETLKNEDSSDLDEEEVYKKYYLTSSKPANNLLRLDDEFVHTALAHNSHQLTKPDKKEYTEVSYEFSSDLSKQVNNQEIIESPTIESSDKFKLNYSKSFTKADNTETNLDLGNGESSFLNPFRRSAFSKSFTAFTTRLKQSRASNKSSIKNFNFAADKKELELTEKANNDLVKNQVKNNESPFSSPELSSSSNFSSNSSISNTICRLDTNAHQKQTI